MQCIARSDTSGSAFPRRLAAKLGRPPRDVVSTFLHAPRPAVRTALSVLGRSLAAVTPDELLAGLQATALNGAPSVDGRPRIAALQHLPARIADTVALPADLPELLVDRLRNNGVERLYRHQAEAYDHVRAGRHTVIATGTASGKSLCYQLPLLERVLRDEKATALYLAPTKALAHDQLRALRAFALPHVRAAAFDGDTPRGDRDAIRRTANVLLTNPDMLHAGLLPGHKRWGDFFHRLALVIVDECHVARGVFGSHVAAILRRLRRICANYGNDPAGASGPVFVLASATIGNAGEHAANLTGLDVVEVLRDGSPKPPVTFALWEPPLTDVDTGARRSTLAEAADLLAGLVLRGPATLTFVKSRKGAELVAAHARRLLAADGLGERVMAYRAGYLAEERRAVERGLIDGTLRGVAATDALELGVDVGSLDAVVIAGWPGTAASLWQQAGRAGRRGREATVVFVAADDPLDHYLLANPDQLWGRPLESAIVDVTNPYVLTPHVRCAAWELPLAADEDVFAPADVGALIEDEVAAGRLRERGGRWFWGGRGSPAAGMSIRSAGGEPFTIVDVTNPYVLTPHVRCAAWELPLAADEDVFAPADVGGLIEDEVAAGRLRERGGRWFWGGRGSPAAGMSIRSAGGEPFTIVDASTGALIGDVDESRAYRTVHTGAVYLHQGRTWRIDTLDLQEHMAVADPYDGDEYTQPRSDTDIVVLEVRESVTWGRCKMHLGRVEVANQVLAYERRRIFSDESLGLVDLDLPRLHLVTQALWLTIPGEVLAEARLRPDDVPGAAHAAEHAAIGLLPLFAMCDRWDIGGLSTPWHPDTGEATIFIYDGYPGGAGIAERGYRTDDRHLRATMAAIASCGCADGCPSCVQSPKCGNGNEPLDKAGAVALLDAVLRERAKALK